MPKQFNFLAKRPASTRECLVGKQKTDRNETFIYLEEAVHRLLVWSNGKMVRQRKGLSNYDFSTG